MVGTIGVLLERTYSVVPQREARMETGPGGRVDRMRGGASTWEWGKQGIKSYHLCGLATPLKAPERTGNSKD